MELIEAIRSRKSIRGFKRKSIPQDIIREILTDAHWAPSASNQQPWNFSVVTAKQLEELRSKIINAHKDRKLSYDPTRGKTISGIYVERTRALFKEIRPFLNELGEGTRSFIETGSFCFYNAPVVVFLAMEKSLPRSKLLDMGMAAQNLMLSAHARGIGTCAIALALLYEDIIRSSIKIVPELDIVLAIAMGYPDEDFPLNEFRSSREKLENFINWVGFDGE